MAYTDESLPKLVLDKNRFRVKLCPCDKSNKDGKFVPYVGYENKGYCHSCGKTFSPVLKSNNESWKHQPARVNKPAANRDYEKKGISSIPVAKLKKSLSPPAKNHFIDYLINICGSAATSKLSNKYLIGSSNHWSGATVFWQIDIQNNIRTGKIMLYSPDTGKRVKEPFNHTYWEHSALNSPDFALQQCFFGEHLLKGNNKPVAIVESEKTALIASLYFPKFIWLASGGKDGLKAEKCKVLKGRHVVLYPDLNAYEYWIEKAKQLSHITTFSVSKLLERKATDEEKKEGLDIADYLLRFPIPSHEEKPLQINSVDVIAMLGEIHTSKDFNKLIIAGIKTKDNKIYDLLFDGGGELLLPGDQPEAFQALSSFFEKSFQHGTFNNQPCWVHTDNRLIIQNN